MMRYLTWVKPVVFIACLLPLARLIWLGYSDDLGANPIEVITRSTGTWTLVFLLISLCATPLRKIMGWGWLMDLRRMFGLFAFFYVCLHFATYIWLDQYFDLHAMYKDIIKRPFITVGFASFVLLIPLAVTANDAMMRRLGVKRWRQLHRLVYITASGGVVHYFWLVKKDITQPLIYGLILALLLGYRLLVALPKWNLRRVFRQPPAFLRK